MPELPDVEVFRRQIERHALHRRITAVRAPDRRMLEGTSESALRRALVGRSLVATRRHGKYLFAATSDHGGWLMLHFGMTGAIHIVPAGVLAPENPKLRLDFEDGGRFVFTDPRTFGRIAWVRDPAEYVADKGLGPDLYADGVDAKTFTERVRQRKGTIKSVLMDQSVLAGLGNVYTDEVLFQAGLDPHARANELRPETLATLYRETRRVLRRAVAANADPDRMGHEYLLPQRHAGGECPRCGRPLVWESMGGRTAYYCAKDQTRRM